MRRGVTLLEAVVTLIAASVVLTASLSLYGTAITTQRSMRGAVRRDANRLVARRSLLALGRELNVAPADPGRDGVRAVPDVVLDGARSTVLTYELVRGYSAPKKAGTDWTLIEDAVGAVWSGVVFPVRRGKLPLTTDEVDPGRAAGAAERFIEARLLRYEVPASRAAALGMPAPSFHAMTATQLASFLSGNRGVERAAEEIASDVLDVTLGDENGLSSVLQVYRDGH